MKSSFGLLFILWAGLLLPQYLFSQNTEELTIETTDSLFIYPEPEFFALCSRVIRSEKLMDFSKKVMYNYAHNKMWGYKILCFSKTGNHSKSAAYSAYSRLQDLYPEEKVYISYEAPYFKVKIGNFRDRIRAYSFLENIKKNFPLAFIVREEIEINE